MSMYNDQVRAKWLQLQCPYCEEWNDWRGDKYDGREDLECGHCGDSYSLSDDVLEINVFEGKKYQVRAKWLQLQCPYCEEWNDWRGDKYDGREDLECGHCGESYSLSDDVLEINVFEGKK